MLLPDDSLNSDDAVDSLELLDSNDSFTSLSAEELQEREQNKECFYLMTHLILMTHLNFWIHMTPLLACQLRTMSCRSVSVRVRWSRIKSVFI